MEEVLMSYVKPTAVQSPKNKWRLARVLHDGGEGEWAKFNVMFTPADSGGTIQAFTDKGKTIATLTITSSGAGSEAHIHTRAVETKP